MATNYGRATTSGNDTWVQNTGTNNQYGYAITSVPAGRTDHLNVYVAGSGGTMPAFLCIWDSSGVLLGAAGQITCPSGSGGVNGQSWQRAGFPAVQLAGGTYYVGFWRGTGNTAEFSFNAGTGVIHPSAPSGGVANVGSASNLSLGTSTTGQMSAYMEWTPLGAHSWDGSAYQPISVYAYDGGAWQAITGVYCYDGAAWQLLL